MLKERYASKSSVTIDHERLHKIVTLALNGRDNTQGIFEKGYDAPEKPFMDLVKQTSQNPLHAVFFTISALYANNSTRQLKRYANPEVYSKYNYLFNPVFWTRLKADDIESAICEGKDYVGQGGYNRNSVENWPMLAKNIVRHYDTDLKNLFINNDYDATRIYNEIMTTKDGKEKRFKGFGSKLTKLFLIWVDHYNLVDKPLKNLEQNGIQVDFQIARILIQTGVVKLAGLTNNEAVLEALNEALEAYCSQHCTETVTPQDISATLWYIGHKACSNLDHSRCPLEKVCDRYVLRHSYDQVCYFDDTDQGRFKDPSVVRKNIRIVRKNVRQKDFGQQELPF